MCVSFGVTTRLSLDSSIQVGTHELLLMHVQTMRVDCHGTVRSETTQLTSVYDVRVTVKLVSFKLILTLTREVATKLLTAVDGAKAQAMVI